MYTVIIKNKIRRFSLEEKILKLKKRNYKNAEKILKKSKQEIKYLSNDFLMDRKICLSIKCNKIIAALETDPEKRGKEMYSIGFSYSLLGKSRTAEKYYISAAKSGNIRAVNALGVISVNEGKYPFSRKKTEASFASVLLPPSFGLSICSTPKPAISGFCHLVINSYSIFYENPLHKSCSCRDFHYFSFFCVIRDLGKNVSFIVWIIIITVDDPYCIIQLQAEFESKSASRITLKYPVFFHLRTDSCWNLRCLSRL